MFRIETRNEAGEWENGIGDGEVYEYETREEAAADAVMMDLDSFEAEWRIVE